MLQGIFSRTGFSRIFTRTGTPDSTGRASLTVQDHLQCCMRQVARHTLVRTGPQCTLHLYSNSTAGGMLTHNICCGLPLVGLEPARHVSQENSQSSLSCAKGSLGSVQSLMQQNKCFQACVQSCILDRRFFHLLQALEGGVAPLHFEQIIQKWSAEGAKRRASRVAIILCLSQYSETGHH